MTVIATVTFALLTFLSRFPWLLNYRFEITENNVFMQYKIAARMMRTIKLVLVLIMEFVVIKTIMIALQKTEFLSGSLFIAIIMAAVFIHIIYYFWQSFKYR